MSDLNAEFSERMELLRTDRAWKRADLARAMQVSQGTVTPWFDSHPPRWHHLVTISRIFCVTVDYLLTGAPPSTSVPEVQDISDVQSFVQDFREGMTSWQRQMMAEYDVRLVRLELKVQKLEKARMAQEKGQSDPV